VIGQRVSLRHHTKLMICARVFYQDAGKAVVTRQFGGPAITGQAIKSPWAPAANQDLSISLTMTTYGLASIRFMSARKSLHLQYLIVSISSTKSYEAEWTKNSTSGTWSQTIPAGLPKKLVLCFRRVLWRHTVKTHLMAQSYISTFRIQRLNLIPTVTLVLKKQQKSFNQFTTVYGSVILRCGAVSIA
jgi:hypothetical protein